LIPVATASRQPGLGVDTGYQLFIALRQILFSAGSN
jgi:hypothetical protein